jgi:glyoxylase-like metal-dependent hydrolase (beta-lactamase superfamily II)
MLTARSFSLALALGLFGCAATTTSSTSSDQAITPPVALETFTSDQNGFDTHSFFVDTGSEVVVFDAQFTEPLADKLIAQVRAKTSHPITHVVVTHPNPDKFQGAGAFRAIGAKVVASKRTADAIPGVYAYKKKYFTEVAKMFTPETYPPPPVIDQTFEGTTRLGSGNVTIELRELANPGVSSTQTVAWLPEAKAIVVGDLVHHRAHAWLEGGIVDGAPRPDLAGWKRALDELLAFPSEATVYGGRGDAAPVGTAVTEQKAYLDKLSTIVTEEVKKLDQPTKTLSGSEAGAVYTKIQDRAVAAYPDHQYPYLIGYGVYGLAQQTAKQIESK